MALNVEVFEAENALTFYVCYNHAHLYKVNNIDSGMPMALEAYLGEYGIGSDLCLSNYKLGRQLLWLEVPKVTKMKVCKTINSKYMNI